MSNNLDKATRSRSIEVGYQKSIDLWMQEGRLFWTQFNIMLAINAIIITLGYNKSYLLSYTFISPAIGIVLCVAWISMMQRTNSYFTYWAATIRELESMLASDVKSVRRGALFGSGKRIELADGRSLQMSRFGRIRTLRLAHIIALAFLAAHTISLYKAISGPFEHYIVD